MAAVKKAVAKKAVVIKKVAVKKSTAFHGPKQPDITSDVKAAVVDEVPPARGGVVRKAKYASALAAIRQEVGEGRPVRLARFVGKTGAAVVKRKLEDGEYPVDGDVADWRFDARRLGEGGSVLFATLIGDAE